MRYRVAAVLLGTVAIVGAIALLTRGHDTAAPPSAGKVQDDAASAVVRKQVAEFEPFAYDDTRADELLARGAQGEAQPIYLKSPGGVLGSATRTKRFRPRVEAAAKRHDVDPDTLEAIIFLESAGRPDIFAGTTVDSAAGLAQILPSTATSLLGMKVDLQRSLAISRMIKRDRKRAVRARTPRRRRAAELRIPRLEAQRRRIDERFDPTKAIDGAAKYLQAAKQRFGRDDLAVASYHMGIGNLTQVIEAYVAPKKPAGAIGDTVSGNGITYPKLYFDSSPLRNPGTYAKLASFGDDSSTYLFRVEASKDILRQDSEDRKALTKEARAHQKKASAEEVLRPRGENPPYTSAADLKDAYVDGGLIPLPGDPRALGFRIDPQMGALAAKLKQKKPTYRGLRPDALATLLYIAKEVRAVTGKRAPIVVTSTVRDLPYQKALLGINGEATSGFSLHTTGYAFDILRPRNRAQHRAIEFVLGRLRALHVLDWVYEPAAFHATVGPDGAAFKPLLDQLVER